jgi:long-chain acyl-CoA synthetase
MEQAVGFIEVLMKQWEIADFEEAMKYLRGFLGLREPGKTTADLFVSLWNSFGDREALISGDKRFTFREFKGRAFRLANGMLDLGLKSGERVAIMLYNSNEYAEAMAASWFIGCTTPLVNWHFRGEELAAMLNMRSPTALVVDEEFLERIHQIKDRVRSIRHYIVVGEEVPGGMISYEDLIDSSSGVMPKGDFVLGVNPYTGGTTGVPKSTASFDAFEYLLEGGGRGPHGASLKEFLKYAIMFFAPHFYFGGAEFKMKGAFPGPLYHGTPLYFFGTAFFILGCPFVMIRKYDPQQFLKLIEEEEITCVHCAPVHLQRILALPEEVKKKHDLSSMHAIVCAAAPCPVEVKKKINELFMRQGAKKPVFYEYYSAVEFMAPITILRPEDYLEKPKRLESVGKNHRGGDVKIFDEGGKECPPNKVGLIHVRSMGTVSLRYPGKEELIRESLRVIDGKEWYNDGLFGYLDEDDFLYLVGRQKEMIIVGGVNIFPNEIEMVILKHPKVFDVAVISAPDKDLGEIPAAIVQLKEGERMNAEELIEHCKKNGLYGFKVPRIVEFVDELPKTPHGKTLKRELEAKYWRGIKRGG